MANYNLLKADIDAKVYQNGKQEITGANLNSVLNAMVASLGVGYQFMGVATPTNPVSAQTPDYKCFYIATTPGTYTNLGGLVVADGEVAILKWDTSWTKEVTGIATTESVSQLGQESKIFQFGKTIYDNVIQTYASGFKTISLDKTYNGNVFAIKADGLTDTIYINLYLDSTLVAESILAISNDGVYTFKTDVAFNRLGIFCSSSISFELGISVTNGNGTLNDILNKETGIVYFDRASFEYGNFNASGAETGDANNVRNIDYHLIPFNANKLLYSKNPNFAYHTAIFFYDENKTFILRNLELSGIIDIPNNARYFKVLFYDAPTLDEIASSNGAIVFLFTAYIDDEITALQNAIDGITLTQDDYSLQKGNIGPNGQDEYTKNVRTQSGIYYPVLTQVCKVTTCNDWDMAIFGYNEAKQFIKSSLLDRNISEYEFDFENSKYYRLVFYDKNGTFPTVADITTDGFEFHFMSEIDSRIKDSYSVIRKIVSSDLDARKNDDYGIVISKPGHILMRETGNIVWFGQKRLSQLPLIKENTPDPTVVKIGDYYYMACTYFPIKIYRSKDMVNWEFYRNVFPGTSNNPFNDGSMSGNLFGMGVGDLNYWAPSMFVLNNKVYLYIYTIAGNYAIAATQLVVADNIDGTFSWVGTVHQSGLDDNQFRDTQFFKDTNGDVYISTGDASSNAKRIAKMSSDLITVESSWIVYGVVHEGTLLYKHGGWYYLFFSGGNTALRTYDVRCFRSQDITATNWEDCGTLLVQTDSSQPLNSAGHIGEIISDNDGRLFVFMHSHCYGLTPGDEHSYDNYGTRYLYCQQLIFDNNDFPHFVDENGEITTLPQWYMSCPNV